MKHSYHACIAGLLSIILMFPIFAEAAPAVVFSVTNFSTPPVEELPHPPEEPLASHFFQSPSGKKALFWGGIAGIVISIVITGAGIATIADEGANGMSQEGIQDGVLMVGIGTLLAAFSSVAARAGSRK